MFVVGLDENVVRSYVTYNTAKNYKLGKFAHVSPKSMNNTLYT